MPLDNTDYVSAAELKAYLRIADTDDDAQLAFAITAASRAIDLAAGRPFGLDDPAVARTYTWNGERLGKHGSLLSVDDISGATGLVVVNDGVTVDAADYSLHPANAALKGRPFTAILRTNGTFSTGYQKVSVTAKFGWTAVPTVVKQACLIQASRFFQRRESPYGIAGSPDVGSEFRLLQKVDPDVGLMLSSVKRWYGVVV